MAPTDPRLQGSPRDTVIPLDLAPTEQTSVRPTHRAVSGTPEARPRCDLRRPSRAPFHVGAQHRWKEASLTGSSDEAGVPEVLVYSEVLDRCLRNSLFLLAYRDIVSTVPRKRITTDPHQIESEDLR